MARAAASCTSLNVGLGIRALAGLTSTAMRAAAGTSSRSSSSRFAANSALRKLIPVTLPPGRARLATRPSLTGSSPTVKTIGIVVVAALAASAAACRPVAAITATWRRTNSAASAGSRSILTLGPAVFDRHVLDPRRSRSPSGPGEMPRRRCREPVRRLAVEKPDHRHRRLLRARRERPRRRRAAEQRDELAALSFDHLVGAGEQRRRHCRGRAPWRSSG